MKILQAILFLVILLNLTRKNNYVINNNQKKEELFRFFDNYGHNGIKINVGPDLEDWYK